MGICTGHTREDGSPRVGRGTRKGLLQNKILSRVLKSLEVLARQTGSNRSSRQCVKE